MIWQPGKINLADLFTKAHPIHYHSIIEEVVLKNSAILPDY